MFDTGFMRVGALPDITPARPDDGSTESGLSQVPTDNSRAARLARLELVRPGITTAATLAHERTLPVVAGLHELIPSGGLQRGSTLAAHGVGSTSFALAITAEAVRHGSFLAVVAPRSFSLAACLDFGIPLRRVVQFVLPEPTQQQGASWPQLVAAIIEGFDMVVVADHRRVTASQARQLVARTRERGSVLVRSGGEPWPDAADLRFDLHEPAWQGLGPGHGHLQARALAVQVAGRRWHGAPRTRQVLLPGGESGVQAVTPVVTPPVITPITRVGSYRPTANAATAGADTGERFAGSDIDRLLDADEQADEAQSSTDGAGGESTSRPFGATA